MAHGLATKAPGGLLKEMEGWRLLAMLVWGYVCRYISPTSSELCPSLAPTPPRTPLQHDLNAVHPVTSQQCLGSMNHMF